MRFAGLSLLASSLALVAVSACEQDCMAGVTHAWLGNYTTPIMAVLQSVSDSINKSILPPGKQFANALDIVKPIMDAYNQQSFSTLQTAIFPNYFHGKCQQDGVDPPGCPNPDCPVVCGTPGSLVHFYPKLRYIVYNDTKHTLQEMAKPGSKTYDQIEQAVIQRLSNARRLLRYKRKDTSSTLDTTGLPESSDFPSLSRRSTDTKMALENTLAKIGPLLEEACGGTNGLPDCSWETAMKEFILSYP